MVFLAGPISGLVVQPLIGMFSTKALRLLLIMVQVYLLIAPNHDLAVGDRTCSSEYSYVQLLCSCLALPDHSPVYSHLRAQQQYVLLDVVDAYVKVTYSS